MSVLNKRKNSLRNPPVSVPSSPVNSTCMNKCTYMAFSTSRGTSADTSSAILHHQKIIYPGILYSQEFFWKERSACFESFGVRPQNVSQPYRKNRYQHYTSTSEEPLQVTCIIIMVHVVCTCIWLVHANPTPVL